MAAKEKESKALPEGQAENPKKPSKIKRIVILLAILLMTLSGAGAGAYWWFYLRTPSSSAVAPHEAAPAKAGEKGAPAASGGHEKAAPGAPGAAGSSAPGAEGGAGGGRIERQSDLPRSAGLVLPLPSITVNIADPTGRRYLKLGMGPLCVVAMRCSSGCKAGLVVSIIYSIVYCSAFALYVYVVYER